MYEQAGAGLDQPFQETGSRDLARRKALELPHHPPPKRQVDVAEHGFQLPDRVSAIVPDPAPEERIELFGDVGQRPMGPLRECSSPEPLIAWI